MNFKHRLKYVDEEAFLFYFYHQNIRAMDNFIDMWQEEDLSEEITLDSMKLNLILLLSKITGVIIKDGFPSETIYGKTEFSTGIIYDIKSKEELQQYERKVIHEYFQLFIIKHRKTQDLNVNHVLNHLYVNLNKKVSLTELSLELATSKSHLVKVFKETMGSTIMQYHTMLRMERADFFLTSTNKSLTEIAWELGYHDQSHFAKTFKHLRGMTPKQYRTKHNV